MAQLQQQRQHRAGQAEDHHRQGRPQPAELKYWQAQPRQLARVGWSARGAEQRRLYFWAVVRQLLPSSSQ